MLICEEGKYQTRRHLKQTQVQISQINTLHCARTRIKTQLHRKRIIEWLIKDVGVLAWKCLEIGEAWRYFQSHSRQDQDLEEVYLVSRHTRKLIIFYTINHAPLPRRWVTDVILGQSATCYNPANRAQAGTVKWCWQSLSSDDGESSIL